MIPRFIKITKFKKLPHGSFSFSKFQSRFNTVFFANLYTCHIFFADISAKRILA